MPQKLVLISDLHIGGDGSMDDFYCEEELVSFLEHLKIQNENIELIIVGDLFDLWKLEEDSKDQVGLIIKKYPDLFKKFKKVGEKIKITVLGGNHDHEISYNKKYQEQLAKYNIHVDSNQYFKREFKKGNKIFRIIGEHGNQVEPGSAFDDFKLHTDSSMGYHVAKLFLYRFMKRGGEKKSPQWMKDADNIDMELVPYWLFSKYFYYEIGSVLKVLLIPMLILFSLAVPYFIFDLVTDFYHPRFLEPILLLLDTNTFFKVIIFILYFDMVIVVVLFVMALFKRDINKRLRTYYGIQSVSEILISKDQSYINHSKNVFKGKNPFNEKADMYINGHTHSARLVRNSMDNTVYADTGSWKQLMKRTLARFNFPSVFVPYFALTYLTCELEDKKMNIELRQWPKEYEQELSFFEKIAVKKNKNISISIKEDKLVKSVHIDL